MRKKKQQLNNLQLIMLNSDVLNSIVANVSNFWLGLYQQELGKMNAI